MIEKALVNITDRAINKAEELIKNQKGGIGLRIKILDGGFHMWLKKKYGLESGDNKIKYSRSYTQISMPNLIINQSSLKKEINTIDQNILDNCDLHK